MKMYNNVKYSLLEALIILSQSWWDLVWLLLHFVLLILTMVSICTFMSRGIYLGFSCKKPWQRNRLATVQLFIITSKGFPCYTILLNLVFQSVFSNHFSLFCISTYVSIYLLLFIYLSTDYLLPNNMYHLLV